MLEDIVQTAYFCYLFLGVLGYAGKIERGGNPDLPVGLDCGLSFYLG